MFWEDLRQFENFVMIQPNDRYDEFEYVRDILSRIDISDKFIFIIDTNWLPQLGFPHLFVKKYIEFAKNKNLKFKIIFLNLGEGVEYYSIKEFADKVIRLYDIDPNDILTFSLAIVTQEIPIRHALSYKSMCREDILPCSSAIQVPTHHFISLTRMPRKHRIIANVDILERSLDSYGYMSICSFAQNSNNGRIKMYLDLIPEKFRDKFPTYLDGSLAQGEKLDWFYTVDTRITHAFSHLVLETSYDNFNDPHGTYVNMISEKSMKPFAWGQVPLFVCCKGQVNHLRELGFDVFDDIIDHSYDNEPDPEKRIKLVIDQLEKLCKSKTVADLQQYKNTYLGRFIENRRKTLELFQNEKWQHSLPNLKSALEN